MKVGNVGAWANRRIFLSYSTTAKSSASYTIGEKEVRTRALFIWSAAEFSELRISSVTTGSAPSAAPPREPSISNMEISSLFAICFRSLVPIVCLDNVFSFCKYTHTRMRPFPT